MDKLYRPLFLQAVKRRMAEALPDFSLAKVPRDAARHEVFSGALLYCRAAAPDWAAWLWWEPGPGVERRFHVRLGWSPSALVLPIHAEPDPRMHALRAPSKEFPACSISLEQVLGQSVMGGFDIPSPWDQLYQLKPATPAQEQKRVMQKAHMEAQALTNEERSAAIAGVLEQVFGALRTALPSFLAPPADFGG